MEKNCSNRFDKFKEGANGFIIALNKINLLTNIKDRDEFFLKVCRIIRKHAYKMVWIGICDEKTKNVVPIAEAGFEKGYLKSIKVKYDTSKYGRGPTGTAIRTKKINIVSNINKNKKYAPWKKQALKRGYVCSAAVPIIIDGKAIGAVNVYSDRIGTFDRRERYNLQAFVDSVATTIKKFEYENKIAESQKIFQSIFELANDAIWILDNEYFINCNQRAVQLFGCTKKEEIINHSPFEFSPSKQADGQSSKTKALKYIRTAYSGQPQRFEWKHMTKNGTVVDVEVSLNRILINGKFYLQAIGRDITNRLATRRMLEKSDELVKYTKSIMLRWNPDEKINFINDYGSKIFGYKKQELIGKNVGILVPKVESTGRKLTSLIKNITKKTEEYFSNENENIKKDGSRFWVDWSNRAIKDEKGKLKEILAIGMDRTKRREAEMKLEESNTKYTALFSAVADSVFVADPRTRKIVDCNISAQKMTGYSKKELLSMRVEKLHPRDKVKSTMRAFARQFRGDRDLFESEVLTKDNRKIPVSIRSRVVKIGDKKYLQGIFRDITSIIDAQRELRKSDELVKKTNSIIIKWVSGGKITFINDYGCKLFGYKKYELLGKSVNILTPERESTGRELSRYIKKIIKNPKKYEHSENENIKKDGSRFWVAWTNKPVLNKDNNFFEVITVGVDITERKMIEEELRESETRFRNIFNFAAAGVSMVSTNGRFLEANEALCKIVGYSKKELLSENFNDITYKDDKEMGSRMIKKMLTGEIKFARFEKRYVHKNGHIVWVDINTSLVRDSLNKPLYFITHTQDITKLKENEQKYRRLFESSKDSILILDAETGKIIDSNPFVHELSGYSSSALIGRKVFEIGPLRDIVANKKKFEEIKEKGYVYYNNLPLKTKSGETKQIEFLSTTYFVGDMKRIQCNIRDITQRIKQEKELEQAKNDFLSMVSHQLRTPLSATKWILESLTTGKNFTYKQKSEMTDLVISNERLINLVNKLLNVTRIESGKLVVNKKLVDLKKLIGDIVFSLTALANKKNKKIKIFFSGKTENVFCDPVLLGEAVENLLKNAIDYSGEENKEISISVRERTNDYLISVHNNGIIDPDTFDKIKKFDKFARGSESLNIEPLGSGLGLFITKKIIEANGGKIWFESNSKSRTTFYLTLNK